MTTKFTEWTDTQRTDTLDNRINTTLLVERNTLGFQTIEADVPSITTQTRVEIPPIVLDKKVVSNILLFSEANETNGRWLRTFILVYDRGGRIYYSRTDDENIFKVELLFN